MFLANEPMSLNEAYLREAARTRAVDHRLIAGEVQRNENVKKGEKKQIMQIICGEARLKGANDEVMAVNAGQKLSIKVAVLSVKLRCSSRSSFIML